MFALDLDALSDSPAVAREILARARDALRTQSHPGRCWRRIARRLRRWAVRFTRNSPRPAR